MRNGVLIALGAVVLLYLLAMEAIDMASRVEYIETHFPRLLKWAERRGWHRVLLLVAIGLLIANIWDVESRAIPEVIPPEYKFPTPSAPSVTEMTEQNRELKRELQQAQAVRRTLPAVSKSPSNKKLTFTDAEMTVLADKLTVGRGNGINIVTVGSGTNAKAIAAQLRKAFLDARWDVGQSATGSLNITVAGIGRIRFEGIYLVPDSANQQLVNAVTSAFDAARPHTISTSQYLTSRSGMELYVIYDNE